MARIFATEVVREERVSYIKAWAYIRRGGAADEIIADIEAGIKKEVSVGCAMGRAVCSICGSDYGTCGHQKGEYYNGQLCCAILKEPMDAYEFSFVAVPAQPEAGVLKGLGNGKRSLKELAEQFGAQAEYRALFREAQLGQKYRKQIQDDVVRLCLCLELGVEEPTLRAVVEKAGTEELLKLQKDVTMFRGDNAESFLETLLSDITVDVDKTNISYKNYYNLQTAVANQRTSVSGVDEDEEALNLIKFQNAYNLASKVISVMSEMYDKLINETGV